MATYSIPTESRIFKQPNTGDVQGNVFATYNLDLQTNKGRMRSGGNVLKAFTNSDDADFSGYAGAILKYRDGIEGLFAISDKAFVTNSNTPTSGWSEASTSGSEPNSGNTIMDGEVFDGLLLVSEATDIKSWNGSTWASWWQTTLSQTALATGERHLMRVGADGNLYIVDDGNKLYRVTPASVVTKTGNGTLDFSATPHEFTCVETSSTRLWVGTKNENDEAAIIEWDMAPNSNSANRIHKVGARAVWCIAIWNDTPVAVLSNGKVKYFNGDGFVDFPGAQVPIGDKVLLDEFVHPNGWDIIDGLPHFLMKGGAQSDGTTYDSNTFGNWYFPSGIYCLDPEIGLYHRFAVGSGASTQNDYGQLSLKDVGALCAVEDTSTKFLCSYEYYTNSSTVVSVLAYHDPAKTKPAISWFATSFQQSFAEAWKTARLIHKPITTGNRYSVFYRTLNTAGIRLAGTWVTTSTFNTTDDASGATVGQLVLIKNGDGAGQILRIQSISSSSTVYSITFTESADFVAAGDTNAVDVLNFKFMGTFTDAANFHLLDIPVIEKWSTLQLLVVIEQAAGTEEQLEWVIIDA